jgi:hypothetical protein
MAGHPLGVLSQDSADPFATERDVDGDARTQWEEGQAGEQGQVHQQDVSALSFDGCFMCRMC